MSSPIDYAGDSTIEVDVHVGLEEGFFVNNKDLVVNIGGNKMVNTPRVIIVNDRVEIISVKKGNCGEVLLNVNFCDKNNNLVAKVLENTWWVFTESIWDLIYKPKELTILNKPREIALNIKIEKGDPN